MICTCLALTLLSSQVLSLLTPPQPPILSSHASVPGAALVPSASAPIPAITLPAPFPPSLAQMLCISLATKSPHPGRALHLCTAASPHCARLPPCTSSPPPAAASPSLSKLSLQARRHPPLSDPKLFFIIAHMHPHITTMNTTHKTEW